MATTVYALTDDERRILLRVFAEFRNKPPTNLRHRDEHEEPGSPEVSVGIAPAGGIAGRVGGRPGSAECAIYRGIYAADEINVDLTPIENPSRRVYNLMPSGIPAGSYLLMIRDKWGQWYVAYYFEDADDDTGTGSAPGGPGDPPITSTGTGTSLEEGGDGSDGCSPVYIEETDIRCESAASTTDTTGTGTGSGEDLALEGIFYLNLYRRMVLLGVNFATGCLTKTPLAWVFVRTIGCCDISCADPDTGTGDSTEADGCCDEGSLYTRVGYTLTGQIGPLCASCSVAGYLYQIAPPDGLTYTNNLGGSTCGGQVFLTLTLYCDNGRWRVSGTLRRYLAGVEDTTQTFDIALTAFGIGSLTGTLPASGGCAATSLSITNPCYSWNCTSGECVEVSGEGGTYATFDECEAACTEEPEVLVACCANTLPETLTATVTAKTGDCTCLPDSFALTWTGTQWEGAAGACVGNPVFVFTCTVGTPTCSFFRLSSTLCALGSDIPEAGCSCDPLSVVFNVTLGTCCTGTATITITE